MTVEQRTRSIVVDTTHSPMARLRAVAVGDVSLGGFWAPRLAINRESTIPHQRQHLEASGVMDNFRRAAGKLDVEFRGPVFADSDAYKWLEAASWSLAGHPDPQLEAEVDAVIAEIAPAQRPDGYLNTYFTRERASERWTNFDLHEMYCAGHLFQAAVAHYRATGKTSLLEIATRFADHICDTFGPASQGKREGVDGHPEVEMGLVELYRATGNERYLEQAKYFLDVRGQGLLGRAWGHFGPEYHQDHVPFREMREIVGHAVRAVYLNAGAADIYAETGDEAIMRALERLWENMTTKKMYVTGGIGSRYEGEAFGKEYELPNARAYAETCAAIGSVMWNWRMLLLTADARYADLIEHTLYNAVLPGISLDGALYFYQNPLEDEGTHRRQEWFGCACCPPNVARTLASLGGYFYSTSRDGIWVHLYSEGRAKLGLQDGREVLLSQHTSYPWSGEVAIRLEQVPEEGELGIYLRIPSWCERGEVAINGEDAATPITPGTYLELRRTWRAGDEVRLRLPMTVRRLEAHPYLSEDAGRVAIMRGPILYCIESADNPGVDLRDVLLPRDAAFSEELAPDTLGGVVLLRADARLAPPDEAWAGRLYRPRTQGDPASTPCKLVAIPYYAWANREPGQMRVWIREFI
ncbi:protein of unknown function DUF1680 [Thermobaculum terrenum ATCC BAA-798]|uniref:Glycoside hydrolase family 127 protein n=1 Tax=Thermobaculum terrenum (strain ATCC BAA-798 / CCMEE 7001 / YNP1) TaxID=525904 RepID=D1CH93_THET1|nr:protein of unknown function DUF1680 [Thermobaculum terrenum ATCC BAA-798]